MRPVVIIAGKRPIHDPNKNRSTILFFFPKANDIGGEHGEIDLINGDVPRIVVNASSNVEVDRLEIVRKEGRRRIKK